MSMPPVETWQCRVVFDAMVFEPDAAMTLNFTISSRLVLRKAVGHGG